MVRGVSSIFFKEAVVSMRVQNKRPRAKGMGEGEGRVMFEHVDFLHLISGE